MTKQKPKRNAAGQFVRKQPPARCPPRPHGQMPLGVCEECSTELAPLRVIAHGHVLVIIHCPRCTPDPMEVLS